MGLMDNRLVVGIATLGRPAILAETIAFLKNQERQPDKMVVAYAEPADIADAPERFPHVTFIRAEVGLTRQRNAILTFAADSDLLLFIDDDFYLDPRYMRVTERFFLENPDVVGSTGQVLADDVKGPGLTAAQAKLIVAAGAGAKVSTVAGRAINVPGSVPHDTLKNLPAVGVARKIVEHGFGPRASPFPESACKPFRSSRQPGHTPWHSRLPTT